MGGGEERDGEKEGVGIKAGEGSRKRIGRKKKEGGGGVEIEGREG